MKNLTIAMAYLSLTCSDGLFNSKRLSSCRSRRQDDKDDKGSEPLGKAPLLDLLLSLGILNNPLDPDFCSVCDKKLLLLAPLGGMVSRNDVPLSPGGCSHTLPIRVCAAQRGRDFEAPDLERGIHFRGVF